MKLIKLFLFALCVAFPFSDALADNTSNTTITLPTGHIKIRRNEARVETHVLQYSENEYAVVFGQNYNDVVIEVYDVEGYLIGCVEADYVTTNDTVVVTTEEDGATDLTVFSGEDIVFSTEL
ncbi:MAG: hypothetical protein J5663_06815 [Bacteroidaceae bacterium]|nr:hypothetical protein [Bacteroidaceae bacterium]